MKGAIGRQAQDVVDAVGLAEGHDLGPAIVPVAADGDVRRGPVATDLAHQAPDMAGRLGARGRLAGAQQHRHRAAGRGIVNVDRQETALAIVAIPEGELLMAVDDIRSALG